MAVVALLATCTTGGELQAVSGEYTSSNDRRSDCNYREDRERIGSRYRLVLGGRPRAEGRTAVPEGHQAKLKRGSASQQQIWKEHFGLEA